MNNTSSSVSTGARLRALAVDVAPALGYTLIYSTTHKLMIAVGVAVALGTLILSTRLIHRQPPWRALAALALIAIGATLATHSGDATNYFLPHIGIQIITLTAWVAMLAIGWPPAGVMSSLLLGNGFAWRRCPSCRRAHTLASLALLTWPVLMLAVNLPLYLTGSTLGLGVMDMLNPFLFPLASLAAWRVHTIASRGHACPLSTEHPTTEHHDIPCETTPIPAAQLGSDIDSAQENRVGVEQNDVGHERYSRETAPMLAQYRRW